MSDSRLPVGSQDARPSAAKDPAAVELGRKGGLKGGKARAEGMTPEERSSSARRAAQARWNTQARSTSLSCGESVTGRIFEVEDELLERCVSCGAYNWTPEPIKVQR